MATIIDLSKHTRYLADYGCGCTDVQDRKEDLPDICANHGDNRLRIHTVRASFRKGLLPFEADRDLT